MLALQQLLRPEAPYRDEENAKSILQVNQVQSTSTIQTGTIILSDNTFDFRLHASHKEKEHSAMSMAKCESENARSNENR